MTQRERIEERAHGRCEYCHAPQNIAAYTFHLEHLQPKKTGGRNTDANFALSCWNCNNKKAAHVDGVDPDSGTVVPLFNPRTDDWDTHFELESTLTKIAGKTSCGRATVARLRMNDPSQVEARALWLLTQVWP